MANSYQWILLGLTATICWGAAYTLLKPVSKDVSFFAIQLMYSMWSVVINGIIMLCYYRSDFGQEWALISLKDFLLLCGYGWCLIAGGLLYLVARNLEGVSSSLLTVLTGCYPVITLILNCIFFSEYQTLNMWYVGSGVLLCMGGISLLAVA